MRLRSCCCGLSLDTGCRIAATVDMGLQVVAMVVTATQLGWFWILAHLNFIILDLALFFGSVLGSFGWVAAYAFFCWLIILGLIALSVVCFVFDRAM